MDEKQKDVEVKTEEITIPNISPVDECIDYGQDILTTQLGFVKDKNYDFAPEFRDMTTQLYMIGVMWKHAEGLEHVQDGARRSSSVARATLPG